MNLYQAGKIILNSCKSLIELDHKWDDVIKKMLAATEERIKAWKNKMDYHKAQVDMLKLYVDVAHLLEDTSQTAQYDVRNAFDEIAQISRSHAYIKVRHPGLDKERENHPLRQIYRLNWPYCWYENSEVCFCVPCCSSTYRSINLPKKYNELMGELRRIRAKRLKHPDPDEIATASQLFLSQEEDDVELAILSDSPQKLEEFRNGRTWIIQESYQQIKKIFQKKLYKPNKLDYAISWFEKAEGAWLLPLFDEHEFYRMAWAFYYMEDDTGKQNGSHDVFIIATSPGTIRPDEYYGPFYYTTMRSLSPGGEFTWEAINNKSPDFNHACLYILKKMVGEPNIQLKSVNRPMYFDNGIGRNHEKIRKVYLTSGETKNDVMYGPERDGKDFWFRMKLKQLENKKSMILLETDDKDIGDGMKSLYNHFVRSDRKISLRTSRKLFSGAQGIWYRYLTLSGKSHWILSSRGTQGVKEYISHGTLVNLKQLIKSASVYPEVYKSVPAYLYHMLKGAWGMNIEQPPKTVSLEDKLRHIFDQIYKRLKTITDESSEIIKVRAVNP